MAGTIAIFYYTIAIGFHDFHLFNQTTAFSIMLIITTFSTLISLSYDRIELAVISLIGGYTAPFMVSTGQGNYVVHFTYISILNIGILAIAYHKKWSLVNILANIFTIFLYGSWLKDNMTTEEPNYIGAFVYAFIFYLMFILITIINNLKSKNPYSNVDLSILTSNTFLFYAAGMSILQKYHTNLQGLFTAVLAVINLSYAWFLHKKFGIDKKVVYLLIGLTLTFITLAIPIQLNGIYITVFWAVEAVLLLWLSQKANIPRYKVGALIVHLLMLFSLLQDWSTFYTNNTTFSILFNSMFITGAFVVLSLSGIYRLLKNEKEDITLFNVTFDLKMCKKYIYVLILFLSYFIGFFEVYNQSFIRIENVNSARSLPTLYHLLFFVILNTILIQKKNYKKSQLTIIIAVTHIILFTFLFENLAFYEHTAIITTETNKPIAFDLHYFSLAITICFGYQLFYLVKKTKYNFYNEPNVIWITAFILIYLASLEFILHGLVLIDSPVTTNDILASSQYTLDISQLNFAKEQVAKDLISITRIKLLKAGLPVLWGILAFVFLIIGIKKQVKTIRVIAFSLLGLTILKLFTYDINNISETGKIISFILLGILILIISFVYQKIKILVTDQSDTDDATETN